MSLPILALLVVAGLAIASPIDDGSVAPKVSNGMRVTVVRDKESEGNFDLEDPPIYPDRSDDAFLKTVGAHLCQSATAFAIKRISAGMPHATPASRSLAASAERSADEKKKEGSDCHLSKESPAGYFVYLNARLPSEQLCTGVAVFVNLETRDSLEEKMLVSRGNCSDPEDYAFLKRLNSKRQTEESKYRLCEYVAGQAMRVIKQRSTDDDNQDESDEEDEDRNQRFEPNFHLSRCDVHDEEDLLTLDLHTTQQSWTGVVVRSREAQGDAQPESHEIRDLGVHTRIRV